VRHCKEHPKSKDRNFVPNFAGRLEREAKLKAAAGGIRGKRGRTSEADRAATDIFGRDALDCWYGDNQFDCDDGSCWRICGSRGDWCWLTVGNGNGP
jgi:hypothetical protein